MEVNGGPVVKKKLLNIIKEKVAFEKKHLFYNVEKLKTCMKRKIKKKRKSDYLQSFNKTSFSFALKLSSDRSSSIGVGRATETALFPFSVFVMLTRK